VLLVQWEVIPRQQAVVLEETEHLIQFQEVRSLMVVEAEVELILVELVRVAEQEVEVREVILELMELMVRTTLVQEEVGEGVSLGPIQGETGVTVL
jgi:hypothetical protein